VVLSIESIFYLPSNCQYNDFVGPTSNELNMFHPKNRRKKKQLQRELPNPFHSNFLSLFHPFFLLLLASTVGTAAAAVAS